MSGSSRVYYNENNPFAAQWIRNLITAGLIAPGDVDDRSIHDVTAADLGGYCQVHLFAGIGGWSYALRLAGWPDDSPVWTGSCPCQPFSAAGQRRGTDDPRHLWPEMHRLVAECRPAVCIGEQVAGAAGRVWLAGVRADLEALGYAVGAADLCAAGVGAPHIRQRLYWVADTGCNCSRMGDANSARLARRPGEPGDDGAQRAALERAGSQWGDAWIACSDDTARRAEPGVPPVAHGLPRRVGQLRAGCDGLGNDAAGMLKAATHYRRGAITGYGNAIVPQVAAEFVRAYMDVSTPAGARARVAIRG